MASAYGNVVNRWQSYIEASITSQTDTTATITLNVYFHSIGYGYKVRANASGTIDGNTSATANFSATSGTGQTVNQLAVTHTVTVSKGSSARNVSVSGRVQLTGGFHNGTSTAYATVSIPARTYYKPHPPKNFAAKRTSDTQMDLTWQGDYTGMDGGYPWSGVYVDRRVDDGSWVNIANLSWDAINYSDRTTSANHKYEYRVCSYGPGGTSDHATAAALYTTPAAPASVTMTKTSGTSVRVDVDGSNAPYATSWDVQKSLNGGEWKDVGNYTTFPQTVDVGGGTAKLRARSKRDSLLSGWTESATITTIVAPNAPTITAKPASVIAVGSSVVISWTPNHPDGSAQTQAQVEYQIGSAAAQTATVQGSVTTYRLPSSATASAGTVKVRVRTHGLDPDWGAWASYYSFAVAVPPEAHFTTPAIDGAKIGDLPLVAEWSITDSTGVASQSLQLMDESGKVLHSATPSKGTRQYTFDASTYQLSNATNYSLRLTMRGGSSLTTTATRSFSTSFAEPARPDAGLSVDPSDLSAAVTVYAGSPSSETGEVIEVTATPGTLVPGFTVFGNTRQNLWVNPSGTVSGVTVKSNDNGSLTVSGTSTSSNVWIGYTRRYILRPGSTYTLSVDNTLPSGLVFRLEPRDADNVVIAGFLLEVLNNKKTATATLPSNTAFVNCLFYSVAPVGTAISGTYRIMLNEGSEAQPWCPPGLNGVDELSIVTAGKNLLKTPSNSTTDVGVSVVKHDDGSITFNGTATGVFCFYDAALDFYLPNGTYTLSGFDEWPESRRAYVRIESVYEPQGGNVGLLMRLTNPVGTVKDGGPHYFRFVISASAGSKFDNVTIYPQLELGSTATAYEPPQITTTPVDLDGHALNSLPDGTRDELRIDGTGAVTLIQRVGVKELPGDAASWKREPGGSDARYVTGISPDAVRSYVPGTVMSDALPPRAATDDPYRSTSIVAARDYAYASIGSGETAQDIANVCGGKTLLYKLATPQEVDLPGIAMPAFPAAETQVFRASNVPCDVRGDYPETESFTVQRALPDGSRHTIATGLTEGQQAIDPLPPLNVDFTYLVTAYAGTGVSSTQELPAHVDSGGMEAFNFGQGASVALLMGYNASGSESADHGGTLYDFATGDGSLPLFYPTGAITGSASRSYAVTSREHANRVRALSREYPEAWFRDFDGNRMLCRASFSISLVQGSRDVRTIDVTMDECAFEEASNG